MRNPGYRSDRIKIRQRPDPGPDLLDPSSSGFGYGLLDSLGRREENQGDEKERERRVKEGGKRLNVAT